MRVRFLIKHFHQFNILSSNNCISFCHKKIVIYKCTVSMINIFPEYFPSYSFYLFLYRFMTVQNITEFKLNVMLYQGLRIAQILIRLSKAILYLWKVQLVKELCMGIWKCIPWLFTIYKALMHNHRKHWMWYYSTFVNCNY